MYTLQSATWRLLTSPILVAAVAVTLLIGGCSSGPDSGTGSGLRAARRVVGRELISSELPAIRIRVTPEFEYVGSFEFRIGDVADGTRYVFVDAPGRRVERMVVVQFEAILPESDEVYRYSFENAEVIAGHRFRSNPFAYSNVSAERENPSGEAALTASLLRDRGYELADEWMLFRFLTVPDQERRHEMIAFYLEPLSNAGLVLSEVYAGDQSTPAWHGTVGPLEGRARSAITFLPLDG